MVTFQVLEERNRLAVGDSWFARLGDAYLEGSGAGYTDLFDLAIRVGAFAHPIAWADSALR